MRNRDELLTRDELNAYFEAWLSERYHRDVHSETGQSPSERFTSTPARLRAAPESSLIDELLRLQQRRAGHKKWSTVELNRVRYAVDPSLRGRKVHVLYDPFAAADVLIEYDRRIIERALPQQPGQQPAELPASPSRSGESTDYLALLRADHEARMRAELSALRLRPLAPQAELPLIELVALFESCRGAVLSDAERSEVSALFRKIRPIDGEAARAVIDGACRRLGHGLHVRVYLDALRNQLVRQRTKGGKK